MAASRTSTLLPYNKHLSLRLLFVSLDLILHSTSVLIKTFPSFKHNILSRKNIESDGVRSFLSFFFLQDLILNSMSFFLMVLLLSLVFLAKESGV